MALSERDKIAHLLRRAGFAARPEEIEAGVAQGLQATVDQLVNFESVPDNLPLPPAGLNTNTERGGPPQGYLELVRGWWLNAMIKTTRPLQEKMVLFWHHLFATAVGGDVEQRHIYLQNENFRGNFNPDTGQVVRPRNPVNPFPVGNFRQILEFLSKDPAMLYWLDNVLNRRKDSEVGTNENYARELQELFSLGVLDVVAQVPNYTERDVRQASRALTGWTVLGTRNNPFGDNFPRRFVFNANQHDFGPYEHLGKQGGSNADFIFDNIVQHRNAGQQQTACGRFLGYRLFKFFGYDDPEPEVINALADVFDSGTPRYTIKNMLATMFTPGNLVSEAFYSETAFKAHIKSPTEYVVSMYRLLKPEGIPLIYPTEGTYERLDVPRELTNIMSSMNQMGQTLFAPFDVSGWKDGANWINTTFDLARFNYANTFIKSGDGRTPANVDVARLLAQNQLQTPEQIVDYFTSLLFQTSVSSEARTTMINYLLMQSDGTPGEWVLNQQTIDNKVRGLLHLMMSSPEFQFS